MTKKNESKYTYMHHLLNLVLIVTLSYGVYTMYGKSEAIDLGIMLSSGLPTGFVFVVKLLILIFDKASGVSIFELFMLASYVMGPILIIYAAKLQGTEHEMAKTLSDIGKLLIGVGIGGVTGKHIKNKTKIEEQSNAD